MSALRAAQVEFAKNMAEFIIHADEQGFMVTMGECYRTKEQADIYLKTGFSKAGDKSLHCKRLAVDFNFFIGDEYIEDIKTLQVLGNYWESLHANNSWGGNGIAISDSPHFSMGIDKAEFRRMTNVSVQG